MNKPKRARRRELDDEDRDFGDLTPWKNPAAVYGYRCAKIGMVPVLGLAFGPAAIIIGMIGTRRFHQDETVGGHSQARAATVLGWIETICNTAGIFLIARGMGWL